MKTPLFFYLPIILTSLLLSTGCKDSKSVQQKKKEEDAMEDFQKAAEETKALQAKEFEANGEVSADPATMDRMIEAAKKLEAASTGDEAKGAKVMRFFAESLQKDMAKLASAQESLMQATDYSKVETAEDIDALSSKAKIYQRVNSELTAKIKSGWTSELRKHLEEEGIKESYIRSFMGGFNSSMNKKKTTLLVVRETDDEICAAVLKQHEILKKHLGEWQWNADDEVPNFDDDAVVDIYNEQATKIQEASARQVEAQKKLLKVK